MTPTELHTNSNQPLRVEVEDGRIIISIGVETLKFCHNTAENEHEGSRGFGTGFLVTDATGFAKDVVHQLKRQREDGSTVITDMLDEAILDAANDGSINTEERFSWYCGYCDKGFPDSEKGFSHLDGSVYCSEQCAQEKDYDRS